MTVCQPVLEDGLWECSYDSIGYGRGNSTYKYQREYQHLYMLPKAVYIHLYWALLFGFQTLRMKGALIFLWPSPRPQIFVIHRNHWLLVFISVLIFKSITNVMRVNGVRIAFPHRIYKMVLWTKRHFPRLVRSKWLKYRINAPFIEKDHTLSSKTEVAFFKGKSRLHQCMHAARARNWLSVK